MVKKPFLYILSCVLVALCSCGGGQFGFGVKNKSGVLIPSVTVTFPNGASWPIGGVGPNGYAGLGPIDTAMPITADVSWTDSAGASHKQHVQINPVSATSSGGSPDVYFIIQANGTVQVSYVFPG